MNVKKILLPLLILIANANLFSQAPAQALKGALGKDVDKFQMYSNPTNNFGVGTSCRSKWDPTTNMVCDMIECYGLINTPPNTHEWKNVNGFAFYGDSAPIDFTQDALKVVGISMLLPKVLKVLGLSFNYDYSGTKSVTVSIDSGVVRILKYDVFVPFIKALPEGSRMKKAYEDKKLVIATADFTALNYSMTINPSDSFGIKFSAKIDSLESGVPGFLLKANNSLGVNFQKKSNGTYTISSTKPLVLGVRIKKQGDLLAMGEHDFSSWPDIKPEDFKDPTITALP